jgi:hypothetical protein
MIQLVVQESFCARHNPGALTCKGKTLHSVNPDYLFGLRSSRRIPLCERQTNLRLPSLSLSKIFWHADL